MGLDLPAKSVAFAFTSDGLMKCDGCDRRPVRSGEYQQMAGRAGRRGRDKHGNVLFCMTDLDSGSGKTKSDRGREAKANIQRFRSLALGSVEPVTSSYTLRLPVLLNLLKFGHAGYVNWFVLQTFRQFQTRQPSLKIGQQQAQQFMFAVLEAFGFLSQQRKLTVLGHAAASMWTCDPLLMK